MSATNRGTKRKPYDFYATPVDVVENFLNNYDITALEIREEELDNLNELANKVIIGEDFLNYNFGDKKFDVIIGNPPYSLAKEFIEKCFELQSDSGVVIMLLRTAFLESKSRYEFWQDNPLTELHILSKRPSFTGKGTDATSYSWFVWDKRIHNQKIKVI